MTIRSKNRRFGRLAVIMLSILLVIAFIAATSPQSAAAAPCKFKHKVKAGETLISIANLYQTDWQEIAEANDLKEPYAVTVDQVLCIPDGKAPGTDLDSDVDTDADADGTEPKLTGVPAFMHVLVVVENFPKNKVYNVRIGDGSSGNPNSNFYKIGRLKTDKKGDFEGYFRTPTELHVTRKLVVCLKDPFTDKTYCSDYENPFDYVMSAYYSCAKPGR